MNATAKIELIKTISLIEGAYAPSTIRAYKGNFEKFIRFCDSQNEQALPTHPATVAKFIQELTKSGLKSASIRLAFASISTIHKLNELPDPTQKPVALLELRKMHRKLGREAKQAIGITRPLLNKMLDECKDDLRGIRNKALLLLAYDTLCRRSELVSLSIKDFIESKNGDSVIITLRKSKTDQELIGQKIAISERTENAIRSWLFIAKIHEGLIFRGIANNNAITDSLKAPHINRIYKALALKAKFPNSIVQQISGHSTRVGRASDIVKDGGSLPLLMLMGRWGKPESAIRYTQASIAIADQYHYR